MAQPRLRIYFGPEKESASSMASDAFQQDSVTVPLGEVLEWLADAIQSGRTWLRDFEDDEVTISSDLYDVILAYRHYRRPSA
ncbi:MAG: hypothetical protein ACODAD_09040 [Planctomycetota bacterium]